MRPETGLDRSDSPCFESEGDVKGGNAAAQRATLDVAFGFKHQRPSDQGRTQFTVQKSVRDVSEHPHRCVRNVSGLYTCAGHPDQDGRALPS